MQEVSGKEIDGRVGDQQRFRRSKWTIEVRYHLL